MDGIGDALVCAPLLVALRAAGHTLGIALSDRNAGIFEPAQFEEQHVLERIPWPKHGSTPESAARARAQIAAARYDIALIVSEEPEAYALARDIPTRIGFITGWSKPFKSLWARTRLTTPVHRAANVGGERAHEAEVVFRLGAGLHPETTPTRDARRLRPMLRGNVAPVRAHIVMQYGGKWDTVGVPQTDVRAIGERLAQRGARRIISAADVPRAGSPAGVEVLRSLEEWKSAIDGARAVLTPDTGAAHLAGMLGIPAVDVFPDARAAAQIARWHPWAAPYTALVASEVRGPEGTARIEAALDAY
ncbi:MAG: hypothetical protein NVS2B17_15480 [Candidatus Velthaea sp.]